MQLEQPKLTNLNQALIEVEGRPGQPLSDFSATSENGEGAVYFRALEEHLIRHIREARMVVGCVAWLTSEPIFRALSEVEHGVALVVQKEDFLRPDLDPAGNWKQELRRRYAAFQDVEKQWNGLMDELCYVHAGTIDPVRGVGNFNRERKPASPRMHNKILVFCDVAVIENHEYGFMRVNPYAVWTGSFNLTKNATASLENAVVLRDRRVGQ